ncbi:Dynamin family GTPase [uncultured virus]|nr:Dynamin family GTPase [uncultured virus]
MFKSISLLSQFGIEIKNWPQIVILGQQNEGKSSLIEGVTQVEILPKCDGLCTRKPIHMTLINDPDTKFIIGDRMYTETQASEELNRLNLNPKVDHINCTILSPIVYNCTIIDTVGLIHVSEQDNTLDPKKIKQDTIRYLKDKNNIFVLVSSAPSDLANSQMLQLIKKYNRVDDTLGVMTKIDLIENQNQNSINDILCGKNYKLGFGWIPTKLRSDRDIQDGITIEQSIIKEHEYCQGRNFSSFSYGVSEVRRTISQIQLERIKANIPSIIEEIDTRVESLRGSQNFLDKIINESDNSLAHKLSIMIEKLVGSSHERAKFENSLKHKLKEFLLDYMDKVFNYPRHIFDSSKQLLESSNSCKEFPNSSKQISDSSKLHKQIPDSSKLPRQIPNSSKLFKQIPDCKKADRICEQTEQKPNLAQLGESKEIVETLYKLEDDLSSNYIDSHIYGYHVQNSTVASELSALDDIHEMLNSGLVSPVTLNDETLQKAYKKEITIAALLPVFELKVDDPLNTKKMAWTKYLERYFSSLQESSILQNKVYEITEKMLLEYITSNNNDELSSCETEPNSARSEILDSKHFTEYIIRNIGQTAFEEKMRYSIGCLVNIEQRPYVNIYDVIRQIILITKSPYLDYNQFYTIRRMFNKPNCNKVKLLLYSDLWNRVYLMTVIDRLALNCYRIVAVNLVNKMVENLLSMVINLNKENSQKENDKITQKIQLLKQMRENFVQFTQA